MSAVSGGCGAAGRAAGCGNSGTAARDNAICVIFGTVLQEGFICRFIGAADIIASGSSADHSGESVLSGLGGDVSAQILQDGQDFPVALGRVSPETVTDYVAAQGSACQPECRVGPVAFDAEPFRFCVFLTAFYVVDDESVFIRVDPDVDPEVSENIQGKGNVSCRFQSGGEAESAVPVQYRQCEEQSCYELGAYIAGKRVFSRLQSACDGAYLRSSAAGDAVCGIVFVFGGSVIRGCPAFAAVRGETGTHGEHTAVIFHLFFKWRYRALRQFAGTCEDRFVCDSHRHRQHESQGGTALPAVQQRDVSARCHCAVCCSLPDTGA